jgi:hypothetical protein
MSVIIGVDPHKASCTAAVLVSAANWLTSSGSPPPGRAGGRWVAGPSAGPSGAGPLRAPAALAAPSPSSWSATANR